MVWSSAAISMPNTIAVKIRLRRCGLTGVPGAGLRSADVGTVVEPAMLLFPSAYAANGYPRRRGRSRRRRAGDAPRQIQRGTERVHQLQWGPQGVAGGLRVDQDGGAQA